MWGARGLQATGRLTPSCPAAQHPAGSAAAAPRRRAVARPAPHAHTGGAAAAAASPSAGSSCGCGDQQHAAPAAATQQPQPQAQQGAQLPVEQEQQQQQQQQQLEGRPQGEARFPPAFYDAGGWLVLKNLTLPQLEAWCASIGEDGRKRAMQLWRFMYYDRSYIRSLEDAAVEHTQNGFSRAFRAKLEPLATVDGGLLLQSMHTAADGTRKLVFKLAHGPAAGGQVETVLIPISREQGQKARITLCVSSQVGCAMNCQFCYTGRMGLLGNLTAAQIVEQVVAARRLLFEEDAARGVPRHVTPITNLVYMGMGEPLHNLEAVLPSLDTLCHPMGMHFSYNKVTVSTVGLVPEMRQLAAASKAAVAVSLHATTDEVRDWIVPVNRRWGLAELVSTMENHGDSGAGGSCHDSLL